MMRNLKTIVLFVVSALFVTSCSDDESPIGKFNVTMANVERLDDSNKFYLTLDDGTTLWIGEPAVVREPKSNRVIINYTVLSNKHEDYSHVVKLNGLSEILTKDIIYVDPQDAQAQDSIGNDQIQIVSIWQGGDYLNVKFKFNFGEEKQHLVNMVADNPTIDVTTNPITLTFRHNKNGDPEHYPVRDYMSFDLKPYKQAANVAGMEDVSELNFEVKCRNFNNTTIPTYKIKYTVR